jgi:hypothetical protein
MASGRQDQELFTERLRARRTRRLSELSKSKYGFGPDPASYAKNGIWRLRPERVLSWERFPRDATRFVFGSAT